MTKRILLVEDHTDTRDILSLGLTAAGYEVIGARSAYEALDLANHHSFDLIISDIGLPGCDGITLLKTVQQAYHIPGISMSGFSTYENGEASRDAGCAAHLVKPLEFDAMLGVISHALSDQPAV